MKLLTFLMTKSSAPNYVPVWDTKPNNTQATGFAGSPAANVLHNAGEFLANNTSAAASTPAGFNPYYGYGGAAPSGAPERQPQYVNLQDTTPNNTPYTGFKGSVLSNALHNVGEFFSPSGPVVNQSTPTPAPVPAGPPASAAPLPQMGPPASAAPQKPSIATGFDLRGGVKPAPSNQPNNAVNPFPQAPPTPAAAPPKAEVVNTVGSPFGGGSLPQTPAPSVGVNAVPLAGMSRTMPANPAAGPDWMAKFRQQHGSAFDPNSSMDREKMDVLRRGLKI